MLAALPYICHISGDILVAVSDKLFSVRHLHCFQSGFLNSRSL